MNLRKATNYTIGIDLGTSSVGWAVVDEEGMLYHIKGRPTLGARIFLKGEHAADTRIKRSQRRRYARRRMRLDKLQEVFAVPMQEIDPEFFAKLRQSRLLDCDRSEEIQGMRWLVPRTEGHKGTSDYPTIWHLRKELMERDEKADLRLVYIALHNIVKRRGNFLREDDGMSLSAKNADATAAASELSDAFEEYVSLYSDDVAGLTADPDAKALARAIDDKGMSRANRAEAIAAALKPSGSEAKKLCKQMGRACIGYNVNYAKVLYGLDGSGEANFSLSDEDKCQEFVDELCPDDAQRLFSALRLAYASYVLSGLLRGTKSLSEAMVGSYERHREDLAILKGLFRDYLPRDKYQRFFRGELDERGDYDINELVKGSYTSYIKGGHKANEFGKPHDELVKQIRAYCEQYPAITEDPRYELIRERIETELSDDLLAKQRTRLNGAIPYQLHLEEAYAIIDRQGAHYPFLLENRELIGKLISSRIPYYVGPLNAGHDPKGSYSNNPIDPTRKFAWSVRKKGSEHAAAYPWNVEEVIDQSATADRFIRRMTGTCTYLISEPVLPRHSLLYEEYCVLNELNGTKWCPRGGTPRRFDRDTKCRIYEDLFRDRRSASVSCSTVSRWIESNLGIVDAEVSGTQKEGAFESKLGTYHDFCKLFGVRSLSEAPLTTDEIEEIVLWSTVFEDRDIFRRKLREKYGTYGDGRLTDAQVKRLVTKRYQGWGRLSRKFLEEVRVEAPVMGGRVSIIDVLRYGNPFGNGRQLVLMEALNDKDLCFSQAVDKANEQKLAEGADLLTVENMPGSPSNRRAVSQAMHVIDELVGIVGKNPKRICIEVTRDDDWGSKGKRTTTRYKRLKEALKAYHADAELMLQLENHQKGLDDDRLLLYFEQLGKCLYTGEPLDISRLSDYQIDHILPQAYIKDDSLSNRVLVKSVENQRKLDSLLLEDSVINRNKVWWRSLKDAGLMDERKYRLLTRRVIDDRLLTGFINRQLVETSQIVKYVRQMCEQRFKGTEVVSVRANVSSGVRDNLGLVKCRELNHYHHAHDAFIACQVADFVSRVYPKWMDGFSREIMARYIKEVGGVASNGTFPAKSGFVADGLTSIVRCDETTGEIVWNAQERAEYMRKVVEYKQCFISKKTERQTGAFWDETVYSPRDRKEGRALDVPLKVAASPWNPKGPLNPAKYGGVKGVKQAYYYIYSAKDARGRTKYLFEGVPIYCVDEVQHQGIQAYAEKRAAEAGLRDVRVLRDRVPLFQKFELDGTPYYLGGKTSNRNELIFAFEVAADIATTTKIKAVLEDTSDFDDNTYEELYEWVCDALDMASPITAAGLALREKAQRFATLAPSDKNTQIKALVERLLVKRTVDITLIGGKRSAGALQRIIGNLLSSIVWVYQSPTGIFERRTTFKDLCDGI